MAGPDPRYDSPGSNSARIVDRARLQAGQTVLVQGGAGGSPREAQDSARPFGPSTPDAPPPGMVFPASPTSPPPGYPGESVGLRVKSVYESDSESETTPAVQASSALNPYGSDEEVKNKATATVNPFAPPKSTIPAAPYHNPYGSDDDD